MKVDSHYYCIGVLAQNAGFSKEDALLIAHASAYVDFEILKRPIEIGNGDNDFPEETIMPIVTQKVSMSSFNKIEQMLVYLPFHFIPSKTSLSYSVIDFKAKPFQENDTAQNLFEEVIDSFKQDNDKEYSLIKLGVTMHCIADTYSHQRFSGRHNAENRVSNLKVSYNYGETFEDYNFSIAPQIGHAETSSIADNPVCYWKSEERDLIKNPDDFELAFETIYDLLIQSKKAIQQIYKASNYAEEKSFKEIKTSLFDVVFCKKNADAMKDENIKMKLWVDNYPGLFEGNSFKAGLWWNQVLKLDESKNRNPAYRNGTTYSLHIQERVLKYFRIDKIKKTKWYKFSEAAKEIRHINLKFLCLAKLHECDSAKNIKYIIDNILKCLDKSNQSLSNGIEEKDLKVGTIADNGNNLDFNKPLDNNEIKRMVKNLKGNKQVKDWITTIKIVDDFQHTKGIKNFYHLIEKGSSDQLKIFYDYINLINIMEYMKDGETPNAEIYRDVDGFDSENGQYVLNLAKLDDKDDLDISILEKEDYIKV